MDWDRILTEIILAFIGVAFSAIGLYVTYLINKFIKNDKAKNLALDFKKLVEDKTIETYQVYVEALKAAGKFDAEAQKTALERSLANIKANMPIDVAKWLESQNKYTNNYIASEIEAAIGRLKNNAQK